MKTYKINNVTAYETSGLLKHPRVTRYGLDVELTADQIRAIIKDNPELLEEKKGGRYFFPKVGEEYWYISAFGSVYKTLREEKSIEFDLIAQGVYRTEAEAILARDKQKAIVACWKWQQENAPFKPDWGDLNQSKTYAYYCHSREAICMYTDAWSQSQFALPYFKSQEDCKAFIEANKAHLELLFTK